ncbi:hypothetical protein L1887_42368 [Cichorium endivia]|nr:hypothetical protein L1887_42368 [Cichorium endivia]
MVSADHVEAKVLSNACHPSASTVGSDAFSPSISRPFASDTSSVVTMSSLASINANPPPNHGGSVSADSGGASHSRVLLGRNAGKLDPTEHPPLPVAEVGAANRAAQMRGILLGLGGGVVSAFISRKALNLSKNASYLSGLLAGTGVAYITARQQLEHNLGAVENAEKGLRGSLRGSTDARAGDGLTSTDREMLKYDLQAAAERAHEAGVAGMHELKDKYASSRGDH